MEIKVGDTIVVKDNLAQRLQELGFEMDIPDFCNKFVGTTQRAYAIWKDEDGKKYVTIDMCVEIPIECVEKVTI